MKLYVVLATLFALVASSSALAAPPKKEQAPKDGALTDTVSGRAERALARQVKRKPTPATDLVPEEDPLYLVEKRLHATRKKSGKRDSGRRLLSAEWFTAGTNMARVFLGEHGEALPLRWVSDEISGYSLGSTIRIRESEYVGAFRRLSDDAFNEFQITAMVPHPRFESIASLGLIKAFARLRPPLLRVDRSENISELGVNALIYYRSEGGCSLVLPADKGSIINLETPNCRAKMKLIDLAKQLNIKRLNSKLAS